MTGLDEEILKHVRPVYDKDVTDAAQELLDKINWLQTELARRYLIGAINRIHKIGYGEDAIAAITILIGKLNSITPGFPQMLEDLRKRDEEAERSFPESHNMVDDILENR